MEINIRDNIYYRGFNTQRELREDILNFIIDSKTDKIFLVHFFIIYT
jgi:hypothetical protein